MVLQNEDGRPGKPLFNSAIVIALISAHAASRFLENYELNLMTDLLVYAVALLLPAKIWNSLFANNLENDEEKARLRELNNRVHRLPHSRFYLNGNHGHNSMRSSKIAN